jgi:hypothetical protein
MVLCRMWQGHDYTIKRHYAMKYAVIGFPKCGTVSTQRWLLNRGHDATKNEWPIYWEINKIREFLGDRIPVIVIRDKADALWSFYEYFGYDKLKIPFKEFLHLRVRANNFLNHTPLEIYDYDKWIDRIKPLNPEIYRIEELHKLYDYPHENKTINKSIIPDEYRNLILK